MKRSVAPVSVIIPCYRCSATIERALYSVLFQTMVPSEIILVEDYSDDGGRTLSALHQLREQHGGEAGPIEVIALERNQGPAAARNVGWDVAQQPYVAFLDADDAWHPDKIVIQYTWMNQRPEVALSFHRSVCLHPHQPSPELVDEMCCKSISSKRLLLSNIIATRSVMVKRNVPYRFEIDKRYGEDYHLWLRIILNGYSVWYLDMPLCYSYESDSNSNNLSADLWRMEKGELDVYIRLFRDNLISFPNLFFLLPISFGKYTRRVIMKLASKM